MWFKKSTPPKADYLLKLRSVIDEALKREPVRDYNELIPPSNPQYPWKANGWEILCYYCNEPISIDPPEAHVKQRSSSPRGWRHTNDDSWSCDPTKIRADIDLPHCHICGVRTPPHEMICSAGGPPPFHATPMSKKEEEVIRWAERERNEEMHHALYELLTAYEDKDAIEYHYARNLSKAVHRVLKASPWGKSVK